MFKKILLVFGALFLLLLLAIGAFFVWIKFQETKFNTTAVPYIEKAVPEISQWDAEVLKAYLAPEALAAAPDADLVKLVEFFKKLGAFVSMEAPVFQGVFKGVNTEHGAQTILTYTVKAKYGNGDANITIKLLDKGGEFKVYYFNVNSKALMG